MRGTQGVSWVADNYSNVYSNAARYLRTAMNEREQESLVRGLR
jgi:hypothetical protein